MVNFFHKGFIIKGWYSFGSLKSTYSRFYKIGQVNREVKNLRFKMSH